MLYCKYNWSSRGDQREYGVQEVYEEMMAENILKVMKDTNAQIQAPQQTPRKAT
jgi:hypothetical protein